MAQAEAERQMMARKCPMEATGMVEPTLGGPTSHRGGAGIRLAAGYYLITGLSMAELAVWLIAPVIHAPPARPRLFH